MPTEDFKSDIEAVSVLKASERTPPVTGTAEPIKNFAVFIERLSADEFMAVWIPKMPTNNVDIKDIIQKTTFLIPSLRPELLSKGETEDDTLTAI